MLAGIERSRYMLQNAADLTALQAGDDLKVTVTNRTGHKLPTGYPEGRRIWINVQFYNDANELISESAAYDSDTGILSHDEEAKIYEVEPAIDETVSGIVPIGATSAQVTLYYQSTSKEFIEFLRDENHGTPTDEGAGLVMYNLWNDNGKCPPEVMKQIQIDLILKTVPGDLDRDLDVDILDFAIFADHWLWSYQ
jgi:hypothetical protein